MDENNRFQYMMGSVANYKHCIISQPISHWSVVTDTEVQACYVQYESFAEAGYIESDWERIEKGYVSVDNLLKYLDEKSIRNSDEVKREREERWARLRARANK